MEKGPPKVVRYDVCIKKSGNYYIVGRFFVRTHKGELMFVPSLKYVRKDKTKSGEEIEHFMWHASGQYHLKKKIGVYDVQQEAATSVPIKETGLQPLIQVHVNDVTQLITKSQADRLDVILDIGDYKGSLCVEISLLSGKWLLEKRPEVGFGFIVSEPLLAGLIAKDRRAIGKQSDNADKIIQFSASKANMPDLDPNVNVMLTTFPYQNLRK